MPAGFHAGRLPCRTSRRLRGLTWRWTALCPWKADAWTSSKTLLRGQHVQRRKHDGLGHSWAGGGFTRVSVGTHRSVQMRQEGSQFWPPKSQTLWGALAGAAGGQRATVPSRSRRGTPARPDPRSSHTGSEANVSRGTGCRSGIGDANQWRARQAHADGPCQCVAVSGDQMGPWGPWQPRGHTPRLAGARSQPPATAAFARTWAPRFSKDDGFMCFSRANTSPHSK